MRVKGWRINGFGHFSDYEVNNLGDGITVFLGPNEAGKSTLLAFIRGVLFGFPSGNTSEAKYPPLGNVAHGGQLLLQADGVDFSVERFAGKRKAARITLSDGTEKQEEWLRAVLGHSDAKVFKSVFAFGLGELRSFETIVGQGVDEKIFLSAFTGAGPSPSDLVSKLEQEMKELFKPMGESRVGALLREHENASERLAAARSEAIRHAGLVREEETSSERIAETEQQLSALRARLSRLKLFLEQWEFWSQHCQRIERISSLEKIESFPADASERLATSLERLRGTEQRVREIGVELESKVRQFEGLKAQLDDRLAEQQQHVLDRCSSITEYQAWVSKLPELAAKEEAARIKVMAKLEEIGLSDLDSEGDAIDVSLLRKEELRSFETSMAENRLALSGAEVALSAAHKEKEKKAREVGHLLHELDGIDKIDQAELKRQEDTLTFLRIKQEELAKLEAELKGLQIVIADRESDSQAEPDASAGQSSNISTSIALALLFVVLAGTALWQLLSGNTPLFAVLILLALIVSALAAAQLWSSRHGQKQVPPAVSRREETLGRHKQNAVSLTNRIAQLKSEMAAKASEAGLKQGSSTLEIEAQRMSLHDRRRSLERYQDIETALKRARALLEEAEAEEGRADGRLKEIQGSLARNEAQWSEWKARAGMPGSLTPQGVLDLFKGLELARTFTQEHDELVQAIQLHEKWIREWEHDVRGLIESCGRTWSSGIRGEYAISELKQLQRDCKAEQENRNAAATAGTRISELESLLWVARQELEAARGEQAKLFEQAGVSSEIAFRQRQAIYDERQALRKKIDDYDAVLNARIGLGPEANEILGELAHGYLSDWENEQMALELQLKALGEKRDSFLKAQEQARATRIAIENAADVAACQEEVNALEQEIRGLIREWRELALAKCAVEQTLDRFTRNRQPEVLKYASSVFNIVTDGHYERIISDENGKSLSVLGTKDEKKRPEELSRGTAEQLYIALRLGLASEMASQSAHLPIVMDDVFVNFDPERARRMASAIAEFSQEHQVLIFTCHPQTAKLMQDVCGEVQVIEMTRYALT
jgi:uncharacterized protein YhaN